MKIPVLILIFNRPDKTERLIKHLSFIKPYKIYVGADGPRSKEELNLTETTRKIIRDKIDWQCTVEKKYRNENLGCRKAVSQAISWFFQHEKFGIILEDDCLPDSTFFNWCEELLQMHQENKQIMHISALNLFELKDSRYDYHFSHYPRVWGWATWRRAWELYTDDVSIYQNLSKNSFKNLYPRKFDRTFWKLILEKMLLPKSRLRNQSWAYFWAMSIRINQGICITPNVNLVKNIGFDLDATNTKDSSELSRRVKSVKVRHLKQPYKHPEKIEVHYKADTTFMKYQLVDSRWKRFKIYIKMLLPFLKPKK